MRRNITTWRAFWFTLIGGPIALAFLIAIFGRGVEQCVDELRQERLLDAEHLTAQGVIVGYAPGLHKAPPQAIVAYQVAGRDYEARLHGMGATPKDLQLGRAIAIEYSRADPSVSRAAALAATTRSCSGPELIFKSFPLAMLMLLFVIEIVQAWRGLRGVVAQPESPPEP